MGESCHGRQNPVVWARTYRTTIELHTSMIAYRHIFFLESILLNSYSINHWLELLLWECYHQKTTSAAMFSKIFSRQQPQFVGCTMNLLLLIHHIWTTYSTSLLPPNRVISHGWYMYVMFADGEQQLNFFQTQMVFYVANYYYYYYYWQIAIIIIIIIIIWATQSIFSNNNIIILLVSLYCCYYKSIG